MRTDIYGQQIYRDNDICDLLMRGHELESIKNIMVDDSVHVNSIRDIVDNIPEFIQYQESTESLEDFDRRQQAQWNMPLEYKNLDIAEYVLSLCENEAELQRCGEELLLYQQFDLFDLLRYLNFLVNTMRQNNIIWGVGRGSSVASFVLYKLGIHRVNSLYYDLNPREFLR